MGSSLYPRISRILMAHSCYRTRQGKGSHEIWHSPVNGRTVTIATTITSHILGNAILKQAGISQRI